ncbi:class I SAM-dependent methyltransferase [Mesorhizobium abyssinicae]|uniref:class I SAM-dependent methyltransferase n=1 Tax=Mesorhizobium TaxID=68287 RepID=UPI000FD34B40|nr:MULTISPECIES: class I SAM-dependent methyltransferase [Mesorhizobium]RVC64538.1 class I SAM-dependent methyltransferase [Mesorhizobium sp. M4B.F.Ca.ET.088.02.2.1]MDX8436152.1 class I SAM-dependent methyltransferase [Mesorhizobium abyssinicae]RWF26880.1 MAG: class I SAM-dependent methyltransferase [Mesorhizobium sp.]RWF41039.1 MAG: class I SAM-dependent methyltransferase [Mesorhizobium sp.]TIX17952.1 MAG: class I SAM-dependent methyltransferase [Mesorhizobium sp.]
MLKTAALKIPQIKRLWQDRANLLAEREALLRENERLRGAGILKPGNVFFHYNCNFDAIATINNHARYDLQPHPSYMTNFLGVRISPRFFPGLLDGKAGTIEQVPIPHNWHADIAEWAAALRAVDLASNHFRAVELGCGWACWLNNTGVAARSRGLSVELIGIEGDSEHVAYAHEAMHANGFLENEFRIIHGVAAPEKGVALFPVVDNAGASWGSEPILNATAAQIKEASASGHYQQLGAFPLSEIVQGKPVDLLHIDIQGGEADFVEAAMSDLNQFVRYVVIGTHSRQIEGQIMNDLLDEGWSLEMERPAIFRLDNGSPQIAVDGIQGWRNPSSVKTAAAFARR